MGVASYTYSQLPEEFARNLPGEQEFKILLSDINLENKESD
jgi:hypothetical protein